MSRCHASRSARSTTSQKTTKSPPPSAPIGWPRRRASASGTPNSMAASIGHGLDTTLFNLLAHDKDKDPRDASAAIREQKLMVQGPLDTAPSATTFAVYEAGREAHLPARPSGSRSRGARVGSSEHCGHRIIRIPLYPTGDWPNAQPFVIELYDHPFDPPSVPTRRHIDSWCRCRKAFAPRCGCPCSSEPTRCRCSACSRCSMLRIRRACLAR